MNGIIQNYTNKTLSGLCDINADEITTTNITATNIFTTDGMNINTTLSNVSTELTSYETSNNTNITSLQNQINGITSTSTSGGGFFVICCERVAYGVGYVFSYGSGTYNGREIVLPYCTLIGLQITVSIVPSTTMNISIYKNSIDTGLVATIPAGAYSSQSFSYNIVYNQGDTFKLMI